MTAASVEAPSIIKKVFEVLEAFGRARPLMSLSDLARSSGLPKSTTHRVLQQLIEVGVVERDGRRYRLGSLMFALSSRSREAELRGVALVHMSELNRCLGHTLNLAILAGHDALYLETLQARATAESPATVGGRVPAHCTAIGRMLLSQQPASTLEDMRAVELTPLTQHSITNWHDLAEELRTTRERGYAVDRQEAALGLNCVSVPVTVMGRCVAAISIAHSTKVTLSRQVIPALREASARIARDLSRSTDLVAELVPELV